MKKRECGECSACCTASEAIPEVGKGRWERCPKLTPEGKCSIYETRPAECRAFNCLYLQGEGPSAERPDRLGVLPFYSREMALRLGQPGELLCAQELRPEAFTGEPAILYFRKHQGELVLLIRKDVGGYLVGPPEKMEAITRYQERLEREWAEQN